MVARVGTSTPAVDAASRAFSLAVSFVIDRLEGGEKAVTDAGLLTRYGISLRANPDVDVAHLTREQAVDIYRQRYWSPVHADVLPEPLALMVFDAAVNQGVKPAIVMLQRVLGIADDGIMGPQTIIAARHFEPQSELRARYNELRLRTYEHLAATYPQHKPNLYGWACRVFRVADEAGRWSMIT